MFFKNLCLLSPFDQYMTVHRKMYVPLTLQSLSSTVHQKIENGFMTCDTNFYVRLSNIDSCLFSKICLIEVKKKVRPVSLSPKSPMTHEYYQLIHKYFRFGRSVSFKNNIVEDSDFIDVRFFNYDLVKYSFLGLYNSLLMKNTHNIKSSFIKEKFSILHNPIKAPSEKLFWLTFPKEQPGNQPMIRYHFIKIQYIYGKQNLQFSKFYRLIQLQQELFYHNILNSNCCSYVFMISIPVEKKKLYQEIRSNFKIQQFTQSNTIYFKSKLEDSKVAEMQESLDDLIQGITSNYCVIGRLEDKLLAAYTLMLNGVQIQLN